MLSPNPFDLVYNELFKLISGSPGIVLAIPRVEDNVISTNSDKIDSEWLVKKTETALRQIILYQSNFSGNLTAASNRTELRRNYRLLCAAEKGRFDATMSAIEWGIICTLVDAQYVNSLRQLSWHGHKFVANVRLSNFSSGEMDTDQTQLVGWASICEFEIQFDLPQNMLRSYARGEEIRTPEYI